MKSSYYILIFLKDCLLDLLIGYKRRLTRYLKERRFIIAIAIFLAVLIKLTISFVSHYGIGVMIYLLGWNFVFALFVGTILLAIVRYNGKRQERKKRKVHLNKMGYRTYDPEINDYRKVNGVPFDEKSYYGGTFSEN